MLAVSLSRVYKWSCLPDVNVGHMTEYYTNCSNQNNHRCLLFSLLLCPKAMTTIKRIKTMALEKNKMIMTKKKHDNDEE